MYNSDGLECSWVAVQHAPCHPSSAACCSAPASSQLTGTLIVHGFLGGMHCCCCCISTTQMSSKCLRQATADRVLVAGRLMNGTAGTSISSTMCCPSSLLPYPLLSWQAKSLCASASLIVFWTVVSAGTPPLLLLLPDYCKNDALPSPGMSARQMGPRFGPFKSSLFGLHATLQELLCLASMAVWGESQALAHLTFQA